MGINHLDIATKDVQRLHTTRHAWLMYGLVRWLHPQVIVEVGAWHGFCTMHLAQALEDNGFGEIHVIDDYSLGNAASEIHNNLAKVGLAQRLRLISGKSTEVKWPDKVDFAFIDGDHSFEGCEHDCAAAMVRGAKCICIHDTTGWWGPRDYIESVRTQTGHNWDLIDQNFDSGFAVMVLREEKPPVFYSEEAYPQGHV